MANSRKTTRKIGRITRTPVQPDQAVTSSKKSDVILSGAKDLCILLPAPILRFHRAMPRDPKLSTERDFQLSRLLFHTVDQRFFKAIQFPGQGFTRKPQ